MPSDSGVRRPAPPAACNLPHRLHAGLLVVALAVAALALPGRPAHAGVRSQPAYSLAVVSQPLWYGAGGSGGDRLNLLLEITNGSETPLRGFSIVLTAGGRVVSRSELSSIYAGAPLSGTTETLTYVRRTVRPGGSTTVRIGSPLTTFPTLASASEGGVYPLSVALDDLSVTPVRLDSVTTSLILYPHRPDPPLGLVPVLPLHAQPARNPNEVFDLSESPRPAWDERRGWLPGMLDAAQRATDGGLHLGLAPTPRLLEEAGDMADGYRRRTPDGAVETVPSDAPSARRAARLVSELGRLAGRRTVQPLLVPYSSPDLPSLNANLPAAGEVLPLIDQIREANSVFAGLYDRRLPDRWLFPPGGRLDQGTLAALRLADAARRTLFGAASLTGPGSGCPEASGTLTFACPVRVKTSAGAARGLVEDASLGKLLRATSDGRTPMRLGLQRFFAETAMIREEQPNVAGRVVSLIVPESWHPAPRFSRLFLSGLGSAPWLDTMTPSEGLRRGHETAGRRLVGALRPLAGTPDPAYWSQIGGALSAVDTFASMNPPAAIRQRLGRNVLVAESRSWWTDAVTRATGLSYASDAASDAASIMHAVSLPSVNRTQTLTSHSGDLQIVAFNDAGFPLTVRLRFESTKLGFRRRTLERTLVPGKTERIAIRATARSSGIFSMLVSLETPNGAETITDQAIEIRSTSFNLIALVLTIGALAFLVFFAVARRARRRREGPPSAVRGPDAGRGHA